MCHRYCLFRTLAVLADLPLATDLGTGAPLEEMLKRGVVATRLARAVGRTEAEVADVLYVALLQGTESHARSTCMNARCSAR